MVSATKTRKKLAPHSAGNNGAGAQAVQLQLLLDYIAISQIDLSPYQRSYEHDEELPALAEDMRVRGQDHPVTVRPREAGRFELLDGGRRFTVARDMLQWTEIRAEVREVADDQVAAQIVLGANIQRRDWSPLERARFLRRYIDDYGVTQEEAGNLFGLAQETVSNLLRVLAVPDEIKELVETRRLTTSHVKALLLLDHEPKMMVRLARRAAADEAGGAPMSVRELEREIDWKSRELNRKQEEKGKQDQAKSVTLPLLRERLIEGLEETGDKEWPYREASTCYRVLFARVRLNWEILSPAKPSLVQHENFDLKDPELVAECERLGVAVANQDGVTLLGCLRDNSSLGYGASRAFDYYPQPWLRRLVGAGGAQPCPCGGEHVMVAGWGALEQGDPCAGYASESTKTKDKPKRVVYCAEPRKVLLAIARRLGEITAAQRAAAAAVDAQLEEFCALLLTAEIAPVLAQAIAFLTMDDDGVKKALKEPGQVLAGLVLQKAVDFRQHGRRRNAGAYDGDTALARVLTSIIGKPAKGKNGREPVAVKE